MNSQFLSICSTPDAIKFDLPGKIPPLALIGRFSSTMPRGQRVLKELTDPEEAKQAKKAKKPSTRGGKSSKKMETGATKQTTKKRKTKAEGLVCMGQSSFGTQTMVEYTRFSFCSSGGCRE